ncbi:putative cytokinin riboside 5'-monophosphate phosphoribohydrolase LOGL10 [Canna indica]|uniref:cytokinin riboside 5'-monophosphate phosphoribohydrolase n=1 Tax=Canna indica TaxID=4628 RepID=A0AAQ3L8A4_9LILI|nr:putative cytokinin riboside 5'-monophosphate phosphoribohydrolase LOGL10 [Canna indica]
MEEVLEVITWAQLGIHNKPVGLLNVDGYYDFFLSFIDKAVDDGFIQPTQRRLFLSVSNARDLVQNLEEYMPVQDDVVARLHWETTNQ